MKQLNAKYCARHGFSHVEEHATDSPFWKDILKSMPLIMRGTYFIIGGDGKSVNIWTDPWVPNLDGYKVWHNDDVDDLPSMVFELIDQDSKTWNHILLNCLFDNQMVDQFKCCD